MMMHKAGRNDPCPCGSGKKFKQCCLARQEGAGQKPQQQSPRQTIQQTMEHHRAGRLGEAEAGYRQLLRTDPRNPQFLYSLGLICRSTGRPTEAVTCFRQAAAAAPGTAEIHLVLGNTLKDQGKMAEAAAAYQQALAVKADFVEAHNNLGTVRACQGRVDEALSCYRTALALRPGFADAHVNLANVLRDRGRPEEAVASYRAALALRPELVEIHQRVANTLCTLKRFDEAVASFRTAIALRPDSAELHHELGGALRDQGRPDEAIDAYRTATSLRPGFTEAHYNLGGVLKRAGRLDEAVASYRAALALKPDLAEAECHLGNILTSLVRFDEAVACYRRALAIRPGYETAAGALIFTQQYHPGLTSQELFDQAREFGRMIEGPLTGRRSTPRPPGSPGGRIKVGFVSGDLRTHPVGFFLETVLQHLDRDSFSCHAYANQADFDELSRRISPCFDQWLPVLELTDDELAARIRDDGITILVDLSGHTHNNRLGLFARKPAPVQVTWLGYANTTGLESMDYILADPVTLPPEEERFYTEKVWRLPDSYLCFTPPGTPAAISPLPAAAHGHLTFGCFHNPAKVNDRVVACWAKILESIPRSVLLFKQTMFDHEPGRETFRRRFQQFGIPPERLRFAGQSSREEYLTAYAEVDCALDPFPFPGLTTTCEALWMGVPTLTLSLAHGLYGHNGELIMKSVGLPDWVAGSEAEYVARARLLTEDIGRVGELRPRLRQRLLDSPLCAAQRFARNLEDAFRGMVAACR